MIPRGLQLALGLALVSAMLSPSVPASAQFVRAPYLQSPTETSIIVSWRSAGEQPSAVCWGAAPDALASRAGTGTSRTDHAVSITGLAPDTQYYYSAGAADCPPATDGNPLDTFRTAPRRGSEVAFRMWVVGDSGTGGSAQRAVRDAMIAATGDRRPDLFLHVGDMAYADGTNDEFTNNFFTIYQNVLRHTACWPALGNHEGHSSDSGTQSGPYYDAYMLPTDGSAGGMASGTEAYYSFDWANVHFVVLDSYDTPRGTSDTMLRWLDEDLAAADATWLIVFFHHPPYSDGSHVSDTEGPLIDMRENAVPIMESHGVDLVLAGHSHIYERSYLLRGAIDTPTTAAGHIVDTGDGRIDGDGPYQTGANGTVYVVAGHGGASLGGAGEHPVMFVSERANGSCIIDVSGETMTLRNIGSDGEETDHLTMIKREGLSLAHPIGGERFVAGSTVRVAWTNIGATSAVTIESSLDGGASWTEIAVGTENDGAYDWTTPATLSEMARLRIALASDPTISDTSTDFALVAEDVPPGEDAGRTAVDASTVSPTDGSLTAPDAAAAAEVDASADAGSAIIGGCGCRVGAAGAPHGLALAAAALLLLAIRRRDRRRSLPSRSTP